MKLTLSLTLAGLLAGSALAGAAPAAGPTSPTVGPAAPSAGPAVPAAVPKEASQLPVSPIQAVALPAAAMNTLETGYNLFNLLAAPGMYDAIVNHDDQTAEARVPQAQAAKTRGPQARAADGKRPSQPHARQSPITQAPDRTQDKKAASAPSKAAADAGPSPAAKK